MTDHIKYIVSNNLFNQEQISGFIKNNDIDFIPRISEKVNIEEFSKKIIDKSSIIIAEYNNKIIGLLSIYCNDHEMHHSYITYLAVDRKYRGMGIASKLLFRSFEVAKINNMQTIGINTNNGLAFRCYIKNGFKEINNSYLSKYKLTRYYLEIKI